MKTTTLASFVALCGMTSFALALPSNPTINWSVSIDGGATWSSAALRNTPGAVMVRAQLTWGDTGSGAVGIGAALAAFDGTLQGVDAADSVSSISKHLVPVGDTQVVVYSRNGSAGKIDVNTDVAAAGAGTGWCVIGQGTQQGIGPQFDPSNPVTLLNYQFDIGGADHDVSIGCVLNSVTNQAVRIYLTAAGGTSGGGQFSRDQVTVNGARISLVVPSPGALSLCGLGALAAIRRRR